MSTAIFIFTRDLRSIDNTGLDYCIKNFEKVIPVFFLTETQINKKKNKYFSENGFSLLKSAIGILQKDVSLNVIKTQDLGQKCLIELDSPILAGCSVSVVAMRSAASGLRRTSSTAAIIRERWLLMSWRMVESWLFKSSICCDASARDGSVNVMAKADYATAAGVRPRTRSNSAMCSSWMMGLWKNPTAPSSRALASYFERSPPEMINTGMFAA